MKKYQLTVFYAFKDAPHAEQGHAVRCDNMSDGFEKFEAFLKEKHGDDILDTDNIRAFRVHFLPYRRITDRIEEFKKKLGEGKR